MYLEEEEEPHNDTLIVRMGCLWMGALHIFIHVFILEWSHLCEKIWKNTV